MKLLLASNGQFLIEQGYKLLGIPLDKIKLGWITTASKGVDDKTYLERHKAQMREQGLSFEEFDIEGKTPEQLSAFLKTKNVIHLEGGNTFYLLMAVKETGFDVILKKALENGLIYVGTSAGAYLVCPTIEAATWEANPKDSYGLTDLRALNLVPFLLKVHYKDVMASALKERLAQATYPVRILRDGQGILAENNTYTFVGEGEEVKL